MIALAPGGRLLDDALAAELAAEPELTLLCGRYEGFDERIVEHFCTDAVSIGRYVLAGGELAAMVVCDAVLRKLPGALGHDESAARSRSARRSRARPSTRTTRARRSGAAGRVPEVLLSGHHERIREWRREQSRRAGPAALRYHESPAAARDPSRRRGLSLP